MAGVNINLLVNNPFGSQELIRLSVFVIVLFGLIQASELFAGESKDGESAKPVNRLDFTSVFFDSVNTDKLTGLFSYTRNFSSQSNLNLRVAYLDSQFGSSGGTGFGDTTITWSYLPGSQISVGPWFPRIVGSGIAVTLATGNENQGRGLGSTLVTPFVGTVFPVTEKFSIAPNLAYAHSVDPIVTGKDVRVALLEIGFTVVLDTGWWMRFYPGYVQDFEADNTSFGIQIAGGKVFKSGWALSAHYIDVESFNPGVIPIEKSVFNQIYEVTVSYGF